MSKLGGAFDQQLEAFNAGDVDSFVDAYSRSASIYRDATLTLSGRDEIRSFYEERFRDESLHCEVLERIELNDRWLVAHEIVSSSTSVVEVVAVFEIFEGLIVRASLMTIGR